MSVGVEFDEEEGELAPQEEVVDLGEQRLLGTYESIASNSHHQQEQARLANRGRMERVCRDSAAGGTGATSSFFVFNSFSHGGSGNNAADGGEGVNNYYTSLLTGNCFKTHQSESGLPEQSLKQALTDPFSGELMDDAVIFPCGHSFGSAGVQKIQETNMCHVCQLPTRVADGCINIALRSVVQAFRLDRGLAKVGPSKTTKRRKDSDAEDGGRPKGVQFPYVVSDRVLIKGNKRTPERFVGKQAIITTQCLNGWYLVRTLDNGESVRLQYRSLEKIEDETSWHQQGSVPPADYVSSGN